jgi:release factor glutamine methyltransferase
MFVSTNTLAAIKDYFFDRLKDQFTSSELKSMFNQLAQDRLKCSGAELLLNQDRRLSESDLLFFRLAVKRLQQKEPFQYILGHTEFYGLTIFVDKRVLIPRPETEELVEWITETVGEKASPKLVDLCTGSGCIALALKNNFSHSEVIATDYSEEALTLAKTNASKTKLEINFHLHDALTLAETDFSYVLDSDVWVSNPPYIPVNEMHRMADHVVDFEPHMALFVPDADPVCFYRAIAQGALRHLNSGGWLFVEIHEDLAKEVSELFTSVGFHSVEVKKDLQGKERMVRGRKEL